MDLFGGLFRIRRERRFGRQQLHGVRVCPFRQGNLKRRPRAGPSLSSLFSHFRPVGYGSSLNRRFGSCNPPSKNVTTYSCLGVLKSTGLVPGRTFLMPITYSAGRLVKGDFGEENNAQRCAHNICKFILLIENGRYAKYSAGKAGISIVRIAWMPSLIYHYPKDGS